MAERTRIIRKNEPVEEDPEDEILDESEEVEAEDDAEEEGEAEDEEEIEDDVPSPKITRKIVVPPPAAKPGKVVAKAPAAANGKKTVAAPAVVKAVPAKAAVPAKKVATPAPTAIIAKAKPAPVEDEAEEPTFKVKKVETAVLEQMIMGIMEQLNDHQAIQITRVSEDKFTISLADKKATASMEGKLSGAAYWKEVLTTEYVEWQKEWTPLNTAEKAALCKKVKAKFEPTGNVQVDAIKMAAAYCTALGIEKYKPEYQNQKAREAVKA
jgi:hypothetical protein